QVPVLSSGFSPIDPETPKDVYMKTSRRDGEQWQLVFSDEFNTEGRRFYPGDDPYWNAVDLNYWATGNLEWLPPRPLHSSERKPITYILKVVSILSR
ncbi:SKN1-domain-containing protein, partial [Hymenopellis radicata]